MENRAVKYIETVTKFCHLLQSKPTVGNIQSSASTHQPAPAMCLQSCRCRNPLHVAPQLLVTSKTYSAPGSLTFMLRSDGKPFLSAGQVQSEY